MKTTNLSPKHALLTSLFFAALIPCFGATKYVSNSGNNANSGNSWAQAWQTLQYGADHLNAGDTLWMADGTYTGFDMRTTGTAANPIVFIAAGNNVTINVHNPVTTDGINVEGADYIEINGVRVINQPRNGIRLVNADHCIVRNTYCDNNFERGIFTGFTDDLLLEYNECLNSNDEHGIYVSNSSDRSIIRYNVCHHNNRGGIQINADESQGGDGISTDPEIYGNILYENGVAGGAAINLDGVQGAFIYNNVLYQNHATGIALFQQDGAEPSVNAVIVHNTIINASNARWCILAVNGSYGAQVFNNILINQHPWRGSIALDPDAVQGFDSDYNIVVNSLSADGDGEHIPLTDWQALGYDAHSFLAGTLASLFSDAGSGDFHLIENSPAIDAGSGAVAFGVNTDIEGVDRPQGIEHDPGAYEFQGALSIDEDSAKEDQNGLVRDFLITPYSIDWLERESGVLTIFSPDGRALATFSMKRDGHYSTTTLPAGMYIAVISEHQVIQWVKKFVVQP